MGYFNSELISSDSLWQMTFIVLAILFAGLLFVSFIAIFKHFQNNKISNTMMLLQPRFDQLVLDGREGRYDRGIIVALICTKHYPYFERFLRNRIASIDSLDVSVERKLSEMSGFTEWTRKRANTSRGWRQANALRTLSYLRDSRDADIFRHALSSKFFQSRFVAAIGLSLIYDSGAIPLIIKALSTSEQPHRDLLLTVLSPLVHCAAPLMTELVMDSSTSEPVQCVLIDILRESGYKEAFLALKEKLSVPNEDELTIHLIEAIGMLGQTGDGAFLQRWVQHENPSIRVKTITAISKLDGEKALPIIELYMEDKSWWVRRAAAEALYRMGGIGLARLKKFGEGPTGTFASDVARLILAEVEFGRLKGEPVHA